MGAKLLANWKSTAIGVCVCVLAVTRSLQFDAAGHLLMTTRDWVGVVAGVVGMIVGMLMKDAGTEVVRTPGGNAVAPSHEVPDGGQPVAK